MRRLLHCALLHSRQFTFLLLILSIALGASAGVTIGGTQSQTSISGTWTGASGVVTDASGVVYVAVNGGAHSVVKYNPTSGITTTYIAAGTLINGVALNELRDLIFDSTYSNLYISDLGNGRILKWSISSNSLVQSYVGSGNAMALDHLGNLWFGDINGDVRRILSGTTTAVLMYSGVGAVWGMAFDSANNLFVSDNTGGQIIRYASPGTGPRTTFLGAGGPRGMYFDASNNLYLGLKSNTEVRKYTAASSYATYSTVASNIPDVLGVTLAFNGDLYATDYGNGALWRVTPAQAFNGVFSPFTIGSSATTLTLSLQVTAGTNIGSIVPVLLGASGTDIAVGSTTCTIGVYNSATNCTVTLNFAPATPGYKRGGLRVLDNNGALLASAYLSGVALGARMAVIPGAITTVAGTGTTCANPALPCGDAGLATSALLTHPTDAAVDGAGNVYIADHGVNRIRKVVGGVINTVAGGGAGGDGGQATSAQLSGPWSVALDGVGNLYIVETSAHRIRKVDAISHVITTVAGTGTACATPTAVCGDGGAATSAQLNLPIGLAIDGAGNLYIADTSDNRIRRVDQASGVITTVAGSGGYCLSNCGDGGLATSAQLAGPEQVAIDAGGNLYIADFGDNRVRKVDASSHVISTVAGNGSACIGGTFCGDGAAATGATVTPRAVDVDAAGNLYIADEGRRVRKVDAATRIISTIAGDGTDCATSICNEGGAATAAAIGRPFGLRLDASGNLYLALDDDNVVRKVSAVGAPMVFPATEINTASPTQTLYLTNIGTDPLQRGMYLSVADFAVSPPLCASLLAAGDTCGQLLYFQPSTAGNITGVLTFTDTVSTATLPVALSGQGVAPKIAQTITFPPPGAQTYGVTPITLTATASSGLAVTYVVLSGPATVSNNTLTITGAGTISVQATQAGNTVYAAAPSVTISISVAQRALTLQTGSDVKRYGLVYPTGPGSTLFSVSAVTPLAPGDAITSVTLTATGCTGATVTVGTVCTLTATSPVGVNFNAANYNITVNPGTLTVTAGTITITVSNVSKVYGTTLTFGTVTTGYTYSGLAPGELVTSVFIAASGGAAATDPVATYTLTASAATGTFNPANYNVPITYVAGQLQVVGYPVTITASDDTKPYGVTKTYGANQTAFTATALLNGDIVTSVTLAVSGNGGLATAAVGSYTLTPSAATGTFNPNNYQFTYRTATLSVTPAPLTITARSASRTYGQTSGYGAGSTLFDSTGLVNGDAIGSVTITPSPNPGGTYLPVGSYLLTPSGALGGSFLASNYAITYNTGTLTVTRASLTVTATSYPNKFYGQTYPTGPGSTSFTTVGLVTGEQVGTVTITASGGTLANSPLGPYTLTPSAATGGSFSAGNYAITYVDGTLTVVRGLLVITASNDTKPYGQTRTYGVSTNFSYSGNAPGETVGSVIITASGGTDANSPVSVYSLTPSGAAGGTFTASNYQISYISGQLTVTPVPLRVTARDDNKIYGQTRTYGAGQSAFDSVGLVLGETIGSVTITASGGAAANAAAGTYSLTPSGATGGTFGPGNYTVTYVAGTLTVSPAALSIAATSESKTYGTVKNYGTVLPPGFSSSGLVAGDVITSVTITVSNGGGASNAPVGSYTLTPSSPVGSNFTANNYSITYVSGTLSVTAAQLIIKANDDVKAYGLVRTYGLSATGFTPTGLMNNESIGAVTISASGGMAANAPLGSYTLTPSGAIGGTFNPTNYSISYTPGALFVVQARVTLTAGNDTKVYGDSRSYGPGWTSFTALGMAPGETITSVTITASGGTLPTALVGSYSLTPKDATGNFTPANYLFTYLPGTLTVTPALLTITAANDTKTYGQTRTYGAGSTLFSTTPLVNNETVTSVTITANGGTAANAPVGSYQLIPTLASGSGTFAASNYTITYQPGMLSVTQATLNITASNQTKTYGQVLAFGAGSTAATFDGLAPGDGTPTVTITVSGSGGSGTAPVGSYVLSPSSPVGSNFLASNYRINYYSGTLSVMQAPLTISASNDTKKYGETRTYGTVATGFTASGLANNEAVGTVVITATGGTAADAVPGYYTLTPAGATGGTFMASNYNIRYQTGTLTVVVGTLTITANNQTKAYGVAAAGLVGTVTTGYAINGLSPTDSISAVTMTATGGTAASSQVGTYTLSPTSAAGTNFNASNYSINYVSGTLTVTALPLSVIAGNDTKLYGQTRLYGSGQTLFTSTGLVNNETIGSVTLTASGGGTATSSVGVYMLTPSAATGGSFNPVNYIVAYVPGTLTVTKGSTAVTLTSDQATVIAGNAVTFTATVSPLGTTGTPTGIVTFKDGATTIGTGVLNAADVATLAISTLASGAHSITAVYAGDTNYATSTSPAVTQTVQDFQFVVNGTNVNGATAPVLTQTVSKGSTATYSLIISPSPNATFPNAIALALTGLPVGATATVTPSTIAAGAGATTVTVVVTTAGMAAARPLEDKRMPGGAVLGLLLPALGLLRLRRVDRKTRRMLLLGLLLVAIMALGMVGCGGGSTQGFYGNNPLTYNLQLVATSGTLQHFTTISITVR